MAVVVTAVLGGCFAPFNCTDLEGEARLSFSFPQSNATLMQELRAEGWRVEPVENSLSFRLEKEADGMRVTGIAHFQGLDPAGNVSLQLRADRVFDSTQEAEAEFAPFIEPLVTRFDADVVALVPGSRHCGDV